MTATENTEKSWGGRAKDFAVARTRAGLHRSRKAVIHAATSAIAAVSAYAFASIVLGHEDPIFAATAAIVALGFGQDPRARKVIEIAAGCTLGILIGDLMQTWWGQGYWQAMVVVFVTIIIARFLDSGVIFTTQMAIQSVLVVLLPIPEAGPFARSLDAVVGGTFALVLTVLMPKNLQGETVRGFKTLFTEITQVFRDCSEALRESNSRKAWMALIASRNTQDSVETLRGAIRQSKEMASYTPTARSKRRLLEGTEETLEETDLALGSLRLVTRRVITVIEESTLDQEQLNTLADWFDQAADAVAIFGRSVSEPALPGRRRSLFVAREALGTATTSLTPKTLDISGDLHAEALVMLLRPMMIDFIEAAGANHEEAEEYLPRL